MNGHLNDVIEGSLLKAFFAAHMAHLDMLWTVSLRAREATRRTAAMTNASTASSHACTIPMNGIKVAMLVIMPRTSPCECFPTPLFKGDLKHINLTSGSIFPLSVPKCCCSRNLCLQRCRVLCGAQLPMLKLFRGTLLFEWRVCPLCNFGTCDPVV